MGAQGTATVDFGAWPGSDEATVTVTGQASILAGSLVEAWLFPTATADHSADEHRLDGPQIIAGNVVAGTGFTIYAQPQLPPVVMPDPMNNGSGSLKQNTKGKSRIYGTWTVAWVWN